MARILSFALLFSALTFISCKHSSPENTESAQDQAITNSDSMPQDHTGVTPDSSANKTAADTTK